jgi:mannose-1-phosphate guanylyltransferase/mannose-6-phosphate isomerase
MQILPVIMAGGSGTRLWPLSRSGYPKQFLSLSGTTTLFQQAALRVAALQGPGIEVDSPLVVGHEDHRFMALDQLRDANLTPSALLLEPTGRNTAPALTLAALQATQGGADPVLVVTPADQTVAKMPEFSAALRTAASQADTGAIAIFGVPPDRPETGYGYILARSTDNAQATVLRVLRFVEKPDLPTAQAYLTSGDYFWNAGIFVLKANTWLAALARFRPDILGACRVAWSARSIDGHFVRPEKAAFAAVPAESVDYAVMEKCPGTDIDIRMVLLDAGWSDLGAWEAVWQAAARDENGNAFVGDALITDSTNTLVHATSRLVGAVGLTDVVVVETPDAVLVANRDSSQDVRKIVSRLGAEQRGEHALHRKVHRPWGWYDSIDSGDRFQVKRILVKPGAALSLQMHHHRAEHWIVVSGTAEVTVDGKVVLLTENQSTYIPLGAVHRLRNPGRLPLEIIEVQSGSYLGEDDIVRFEDTYGRA